MSLRAVFRLALVVLALFASPAVAQTPWAQDYERGWADDTDLNGGHFASPFDACDGQRRRYDPGATNEQPIFNVGANIYSYRCVWSNRTNTIIPVNVSYVCVRSVTTGIFTSPFPPTLVTPQGCIKARNPPGQASCQSGPSGLLAPGAPAAPMTSGPVNLASGGKLIERTDYVDASGKLAIRRKFQTIAGQIGDESNFGWGWRGLVPLAGQIVRLDGAFIELAFTAADGTQFTFIGNHFSGAYRLEAQDQSRLRIGIELISAPPPSGDENNHFRTNDARWRLRYGDGQEFVISNSGATSPAIYDRLILVSHRDPDGYTTSYDYTSTASARTLSAIRGPGGRTLGVVVAAHGPTEINLPDGSTLAYAYSEQALGARFLTKVERKRANGTVIYAERYRQETAHPGFVSHVDRAGGQVRARYDYDLFARVKSTEKGTGAEQFLYSYSDIAGANETNTRVTNPLGRHTDYRFAYNPDFFGRNDFRLIREDGIASATCPADQRTWDYQSGEMRTAKDKNGRFHDFSYDGLDRPLMEVDGTGSSIARTSSYSWFADLNRPTQIVRSRQTVDMTRDAIGRLEQLKQTDTTSHTLPYPTNGQTRTWDFTYDGQGRTLTADGPRAGTVDRTLIEYTAAVDLLNLTNPLGHQLKFREHDGNGAPKRVIDENGIIADLTYDAAGRLVEEVRRAAAGDLTIGYTYDLDGRLTRVTMPDGSWREFGYDAAERIELVTNNLGERIELTYDAMGNPTRLQTKTAAGIVRRQIDQVNDELGRARRITSPAANPVDLGYDVEDNVTSETINARVTATSYDIFNRARTETDAQNVTAEQDYDPQDNVTRVDDRRALRTSFVSNGFEEVIRQTSPDSGITDYVRDAVGNVTQLTDARGVVATATYDALDRLTAVTYAATPSENLSFSYDATASGNKGVGKLTGMTDRAGTASWRYGERDELLSQSRVIGSRTYTTSKAYDAFGRQSSITYPSGRVVTHTRDAVGRITAITTRNTSGSTVRPVVASIAWRPFGPVESLTHANGLVATWTYDTADRVTGYRVAGTTDVERVALTWNPADELTGIDDELSAAGDQGFSYDTLGRLSGATEGAQSYVWGYDANGNRASEAITASGTTTTATYSYSPTSNRLTGISGASTRAFTYTATGNVASDTRGSGTADDLTFEYDAADRLVVVRRAGTVIQSVTYDGFGRRVARTAGGATRHYHYDDRDRLIATSNGTGGDWIEWLWLDDDAQGGGQGMLVAQLQGGQIYAVHSDHLGQPKKLTNSSRTVVWTRRARAFGATASETGTPTSPLRFPGQLADPTTATHYNMARDYDPSLGRYLQADPIGLEGGLNLYAYVGSSPQSFVDVTGEQRGIRRPVRGPTGQFGVRANPLEFPKKVSNVCRASDPQYRLQARSYTNYFASGMEYFGKGSRYRSQRSARDIERATGDVHIATGWTPARNSRDAYIQEFLRLLRGGGPSAPTNYNRIESPGRKYWRQQ